MGQKTRCCSTILHFACYTIVMAFKQAYEYVFPKLLPAPLQPPERTGSKLNIRQYQRHCGQAVRTGMFVCACMRAAIARNLSASIFSRLCSGVFLSIEYNIISPGLIAM